MTRRSHPAPFAILTLGLTCLLAPPAAAHLSIIRQGAETVGANEPGDQYSRAVAAGDFNGDGIDDLVVGAPQEDIGSTANAGAIFVNWGSENGVTHEGAVYYTAAEMTGSVTAGANLGWSLVGGDLDDDGFDDLVAGAPFETINGAANAGAVYVMRGSANGLQPWMSFTQANWGANVETSDKFGWAVALGDFDGDTDLDLVIGSPGEDGNLGAALWVLGTSVGLFGAKGILDLGDSGQSPRTGDQFGFSLAVGDFMAGPEDEIVCGAPYRGGQSGSPGFGAIMVTAGSPTGPVASASAYHTAPGSIQTNAHFGYSLAAGRLMAGSYETLAVGEPWRAVHPEPNAGRVIVLPGGTFGLDLAGAVEILETNAGGLIGEDDTFGYTLAVGHFWDPADGWEDLAVGSPGERFGTGTPYGQVQILMGGPAGPNGSSGWFGFNQGTLNEFVEPNDALGQSLAFGRFDGTGHGNLAVGAVGEDVAAGMVHVIAPWRQVYGLSCERSIVLDCNDEIYFSQKPFDEVLIASTTKIMTVLIACEQALMHQDPPLDTIYEVPAWVANDIPGSQVPLFAGEWITLEDLMYTCLMLSGNDAAYAIADLVHGGTGPDDAVEIFVNHMNIKAELIGMTDTHFNNPAGLEVEPVGSDLGEHYSTPRDMAILSAYAMQNPFFREIAATTAWPMVRHFPDFDIFWNVQNIFRWVMWNNVEPLTGIKGGETPQAKVTGCFSAQSPLGDRTVACTFTTPPPAMNYGPDAGKLVQLGLSACGYFFALDEWDDEVPWSTDGIRSGNGARHGGSSGIPGGWQGDAEFTLYRVTWDSGEDSALTLWLTHHLQLRGATTYDFGARAISGHGPIRITNVGTTPAFFQVILPYDTFDFALDAGETGEIAAHDEGWLGFPVRIAHGGPGGSLDLDVEVPYLHDIASPAEPSNDPVLRTRLLRSSAFVDAIEFRTLGHDAEGSVYALFGHRPGEVVGLPDGGTPDGSGDPDAAGAGEHDPAVAVTLRPARPNPFTDTTTLGFDLRTAGEVGLDIYDVSGRLVRAFAPVSMAPGAFGLHWDGRGADGLTVNPGVYFYHVTVDGRDAASGKVLRVG